MTSSVDTTNGTRGALTYVAPVVKSSLYRTGDVLTRRDKDGSDAGTEGLLIEERDVAIHDARQLDDSERRTIDTHGFEIINRPLSDPGLDFYDHRQIVSAYYADCEAIIRHETGARGVFAFDHNVRSASGKESKRRTAGGQSVQNPIHMVHGDYTLTSAPQRLRDLAQTPSANDTLRTVLADGETLLDPAQVENAVEGGGRYAIINLWRSIAPEPVAIHPLALCDGQTVAPDDLVVFEIHYHDRIGENYFAKPAGQHGWWYYPAANRDEAVLIKQWDSAGELARSGGAHADASVGNGTAPCTFSFHTAFKDPASPPDAPDRQSIEVRCVVLYD
ncbi:MAG: CmcJ/NvfI family oxidoreductase [Pseudomonadota bacterium]